ncbi:hypothetical protein BDA99DRAFT_500756 [Phascolomyces articulosus]|uniref:Uncharacterized protein n=1 Tax=Phascolomyces articulosus TaxID=60185 RepID=A0AAD5PHD0_9FUNG|nr:hypothetical protein BDA99DRAFT_500756 [Phascolomyces articulosus]
MEKSDSDTLTHPMLYRQTINSPQETPRNKNKNSNTSDTQASKDQSLSSSTIQKQKDDDEGWMPPIRRASNENEHSEEYWDCYPNLARNIENQGTPEQVEQLHELQAHSPKQ